MKRMRKTGAHAPKPAYSIGPGEGQTSYLKTRDMDLSCYVKDRNAPSEAVFPTLDLRDAIFTEGETLTRVEGQAKGTLLRELGATSVESWRRYGSSEMYERYSRVIRRKLRLDTELRARRPKPEQIEALLEPDRGMVVMHLENQNARYHPAVLAYSTALERQKFFSAVKLRVLDRLRIDLGIPWKKQVAAASSGVYEFLAPTNRYAVPTHLAPYCFTAETTARIKHQLEVEIARRSNRIALDKNLAGYPIRRLAEVDTGPLSLDPRLYSPDRIRVDAAAREALQREGKPLHSFLTLHALGCFGDISLKDVERNWHALETRAPVTSRYRLKRHELVIRTVFLPDDDGEIQPQVEVEVARLPQHSARE